MAATETHRSTNNRTIAWIAVACLCVVATALSGGWAFGFFFFPFLVLAAAVWLFARAVRKVDVRNPLYDPTEDAAHKWADGQPLGRSNRFEIENRERVIDDARFQAEKEDEQRDITDECREQAARNRPNDYQGPPPVVPFP